MINALKKILQKCSKTVGKKNEIDEIMTLALAMQRLLGQHILDPDWSWRSFLHYHILILLINIYVFFGTLEVFQNSTELQLTAEASYTFVLIAMSPMKLLLFIQNRDKFRKLYVSAKTTLFNSIKGESEAKAKHVLRQVNKLVYALCGMVLPPVISYQVVALWNYLNGTRVFLSRSTSTLMPMTSPYYEIAWFVHNMFLIQLAATLIIVDMWFVFQMFLICEASDSLANVLKIDSKGREESQASYAERLNEALKFFYSGHVEQVEYLNTLNKMYRWLGLVPLLNVALCLCIILLVISKEFSLRFALQALPTIAEIFAYCWFGEQIKMKANKIKMALLEFDWTNLNQKDKKSYFNIIAYMSKEYSITTVAGIDLSMITMSSVLKGSYQVFAVLKTMEN